MLKPQDIVILLKLISTGALKSKPKERIMISQNELAIQLCMSVSEVHAGIKRLQLSRLLGMTTRHSFPEGKERKCYFMVKAACMDCLILGVKYFFPAQLGEYTRGIATAYAAPIFEKHLVVGNDPIPVWPYADGDSRGLALQPLYPSVPKAITKYPDQLFYELLVLVDTLRCGRTRERAIAVKLLEERIDDI